jgi:hypothetical protein
MKRTRRTLRWSLPLAVAALALMASTALPAHAQGLTKEQLEAHGWTCVPFAPAQRFSCFNPGQGRPFPGNPDPGPSYTFLGFDMTTGDFLYTGHLIRADLYAGQPCAPGDEPYTFRGAIGYYECVHV